MMGPRTEASPWLLPTLADPQVALGSPGLRGPSGAGAELGSSNCPFTRDWPACREMEGASPGRNSRWGAESQTPRETHLEVERLCWADPREGR